MSDEIKAFYPNMQGRAAWRILLYLWVFESMPGLGLCIYLMYGEGKKHFQNFNLLEVAYDLLVLVSWLKKWSECAAWEPSNRH